MARKSMETVVPCGRCGVKLQEREVRFLWSDVDFLEHWSDVEHEWHKIYIRPEDEPTYWAVAKELARTA